MRYLIPFFVLAVHSLASPVLTGMFPRGAGQGETLDVRIVGTRLENPVDLLFYDEGIELLEWLEIGPSAKYERPDGRPTPLRSSDAALARLKIAKDCRLGEHKVRVVTGEGASELRTFWVGAFPSFLEVEGSPHRNNKIEFANELPDLPVTVNGRLWRYDVDCFRFTAKQGQTLTLEIEGVRLANFPANGTTDLAINLLDAEGHSIARAEDSHLYLADPVLRTTIPEDGTYHVSIETEVPGTDNNPVGYRLHIGEYERVLPYPAGGDQAPDLAACPTPNPFRVIDLPNVLESEPNDKSEEASKAETFPFALNGRIDRSGDVDCFRFKVPEGQPSHLVKLYAQALGSPLDATMELWKFDRKGKAKRVSTSSDVQNLQRNLPPLTNRIRDLLDPVLLLHPGNSGGRFELRIRDTHKRGGAAFVYRIETTPVVDGFQVTLPAYGNRPADQIRSHVQVPSGGSYPTWISLKVLYGSRKVKGAARIEAVGLPKGVRFEAPRYEAGTERVAVRFVCDEGVDVGTHLIGFKVIPEEDEGGPWTSPFQQAFPFYTRQNNYAQYHVFADQLALAITKPAPFSLEVHPPDAALVQNGEYTIPFTLHRDKGFEEMVEVSMELVPANVNKSSPVKMSDGATEGKFLLSASSRTEAKSYTVMLSAVYNERSNRNARYGAGDYILASEMFEISVGTPYVVAKMTRAAVERGKTAPVRVKLMHQRAFKGEARAILKGLPKGVELVKDSVTFTSDDAEIVFEVRATPNALFGMNRGLHCIFEIREKGETLKQKSGYGYLRIDPERQQTSSLK